MTGLTALSGHSTGRRNTSFETEVEWTAELITEIMANMSMQSVSSRNLRLGALAITGVIAASVVGQLATFPNLVPWYAGLAKPSFNPPNWLFGPVWTTLYALMALAVWRILRLPQATASRGLALSLFFVQLALNAAWSWMFFAAHNPLLGLINIIPQLAIIIATVVVFLRLDKIAAWCLVPLVAWVAFASTLNFAIWRLNG